MTRRIQKMGLMMMALGMNIFFISYRLVVGYEIEEEFVLVGVLLDFISEIDVDVLRLIAGRQEDRLDRVEGVDAGTFDDIRVFHVRQDAGDSLLEVILLLLLVELCAVPREVFLHAGMVYFRGCHDYLWVGKRDGDLLAVHRYILLVEIGEVDEALDGGINGNGNFPVSGNRKAEFLGEDTSLDGNDVVEGDDLMYIVLNRIQFGTFGDGQD